MNRSVVYSVVMLVGSIGIALLALEIGVRVWSPQHTKISVPAIIDQELIYRLPRYAKGTDVKEEFAVRIETNALGLRDRDYIEYKSEATGLRLLVLGDSMTFAEGVEAEEAYPKLIEHDWGQQVDVINAAIRGYGTDQEFVLFQKLIPQYHPDIVVLAVYPFNDFDDNVYGHLFEVREDQLHSVALSSETSPKYRYYRRQSFIQTFPGYQWIIRYSHLMNLLRNRWASIEFRREFPESQVDDRREEQAWLLTKKLLVAWEGHAREAGIHPIILIIPSQSQIYVGHEEPTDSRTERLLKHGRLHNITVLDPRKALQEKAKEAEPLYYPKDRHLTTAGHRVVADYVLSKLVSQIQCVEAECNVLPLQGSMEQLVFSTSTERIQ